ncbi:hypothetical protein GQX74_013375 [Glossina fuscipes]|nr:hypothetical protein GQX74_013375 [Glossina fuscipes]
MSDQAQPKNFAALKTQHTERNILATYVDPRMNISFALAKIHHYVHGRTLPSKFVRGRYKRLLFMMMSIKIMIFMVLSRLLELIDVVECSDYELSAWQYMNAEYKLHNDCDDSQVTLYLQKLKSSTVVKCMYTFVASLPPDIDNDLITLT